MKTKLMVLLCLCIFGLSACVIDLSDDDVVRPVRPSFSNSIDEMTVQALQDCGRGNVKYVSNGEYSCFDDSKKASIEHDIRAIEEIANKTCQGAVKQVTADGFVCN